MSDARLSERIEGGREGIALVLHLHRIFYARLVVVLIVHITTSSSTHNDCTL